MSANSGNPLQLRGPQEGGGDPAYVNSGLINELGRRTAPMPQAMGVFAASSLMMGASIAGSPLLLPNSIAAGLYIMHEQAQGDDGSEVLAAADIIEEAASKGQKFGPNQQALVELAKEAKRGGVTSEQARTLIEWARE